MRSLISVFVALVLSIVVAGQAAVSVVSGQLIENGRIIANAEIRLVSGSASYSTVTDTQGNYRFDGVTDGAYLLIVGNREARSVLVRGGSVTVSELAQVVTIAADTYQRIEHVSKTVDTIDGREMRERADFALIESLRTIPGFRVQQSGGFGRVASIKTRGLRNQDTALLIDGIRFRDVSSITGDATPFLSDLTLTSVNRVEVLRGSGSSLYGTNAIGGVVDLQTPSASQGTHGQIAGAFGGLGLGRFRGTIAHGTPSGRFGITAGASRTVYAEGIDGDDDAHNTNLQMRVDAQPWTRTDVSARLFFSDADVRLNANPDTLGPPPATNATIIPAMAGENFAPDVNDPDSLQRSQFFSGQLTFDHAFSDELVVSGYYHGSATRRTNANGPLGPGFQSDSTSVFEGRIDTLNGRLEWIRQNNRITAAYEFERERFDNTGQTPDGSGSFQTTAIQRSNTFYLQNMLSLANGDLQLAGGMRVQKFALGRPGFSLSNAPYSVITLDDPPTAVTFDGSASYFLRGSSTKFRVHVGNGYRVPSLYERFGTFFSSFGTPSFVALGDPFLKPERSIAFDAGIEQIIADGRVNLSATYFYTHLRDIINFGTVVPGIGTTPRPFGGYENQDGGIARGGEFSLKARPTRSTDLFASYTFTNSDQATPQVFGSGILTALGVPTHQLSVVGTQRIGRFWANLDLLATSTYLAPIFSNATFNTYIYRFEGNRRADLTAGYAFGFNENRQTLRIFGTIENLFNQNYYENGFRTVRRTGRVGLAFGF